MKSLLCWFCRKEITNSIEVFDDITCYSCHESHRDMLSEIYIPLKTTIVVASRDWRTWSHYLEINRETAIDSLSQHLSPAAVAALLHAASKTRMDDDTPEDDQCLFAFDLSGEEYVPVTMRLEAALEAQMADIRSGKASATDHQLEYLLALDLQI